MNEAQEFIKNLSSLSYLGVFGIALISDILVIVPEEVVLLSLGYIAGIGILNGFILVPIVIAGLLSMDTIIYLLSWQRNKFIVYFYDKFFSFRLGKNRQWLEKNPKRIIFFARFLIQFRFLGPFMAGHLHISKRTFFTYDLAALVLYVPALILIGSIFHAKIQNIINGISVARNIILIIIGLLIVFSVMRFIYQKVFLQNMK